MFRHAQTNLQLFEQLRRAGRCDADMALARDAYGLAARVVTGCYRPSGKTFVAHLVGTASVLADLDAGGPLVAAGLLHSAYTHGIFAGGARRVTDAKREAVRRASGGEAEALVFRYTHFPWGATEAAALAARPALPDDAVERGVLLMRLANELDDHFDMAVLYCADAERRRERARAIAPSCVALAERLEGPRLAEALAEAFERTEGGDVPDACRPAAGASQALSAGGAATPILGGASSCLVPPATHGLRVTVALRRMVRDNVALRGALGAARRLFARGEPRG